jgi:serine/threonine-protein kinase
MNTIGKYKICGLLGRGGMSKVYKVQLPVIEKIVALKLLDPDPLLADLIGRPKIRELFISEAKKLANLRHPHIVEIWNFDEADGKPFYLMDYYFNNLATLIGETRWTDRPSRIIKLDKAIGIVSQILSGLACLHHAGIIHRDIKPFNILLTDLETVKICDFGLSKLRGEKVSVPSNLNVGSPWYAPPEQEDNPNQVDSSVDLYATGVTLYRMLTGKLPAPSPERPGKFNPDLDDDWDAYLLKSIARHPGDRFSSAIDMLNELQRLEAAWKQRKDNFCLIAERPISKIKLPQPIRLRTTPLKIAPAEAGKAFNVDDLWRPEHYVQNDFNTDTDELVLDAATGLVWQQAGSEYPLTWHQAAAYVESLNQQQYAGYQRWRLPTVDELMSLLTETPHGEDFCIAPIFDPCQRALWSCDRRSFTAAWYVSVDMGFVSWQDFSAYYYVRAVSTKTNA